MKKNYLKMKQQILTFQMLKPKYIHTINKSPVLAYQLKNLMEILIVALPNVNTWFYQTCTSLLSVWCRVKCIIYLQFLWTVMQLQCSWCSDDFSSVRFTWLPRKTVSIILNEDIIQARMQHMNYTVCGNYWDYLWPQKKLSQGLTSLINDVKINQ